jgi:hypothetical protein
MFTCVALDGTLYDCCFHYSTHTHFIDATLYDLFLHYSTLDAIALFSRSFRALQHTLVASCCKILSVAGG